MEKSNNQLGLGKTVEQLRACFQEGLELVKTMQDEAKVEVHLGAMNAKDRWAEIETELSKVHQKALGATTQALDETLEALRSLRKQMKDQAAKRVATPSART